MNTKLSEILKKAFLRNELMLNGPVPNDLLYISDPYLDPSDVIKGEASQAIEEAARWIIGDEEPEDGFTDDETIIEDGVLKINRLIRNKQRQEQLERLREWLK